MLYCVIPRDNRLIVMGSPSERFADNAAHLFLHLSDQPDGTISPVWISGSTTTVRRLRAQGYAAELRWSWSGIRTCLKAGTYVYSAYQSDINRWFSSHATNVCLWHGIPIKRIMRDLPDSAPIPGWLARIAHSGQEPAPDRLLSSTRRNPSLLRPRVRNPRESLLGDRLSRNDHLLNSPREPHPTLIHRGDELDRIRPPTWWWACS
jgi:hypothetical protein